MLYLENGTNLYLPCHSTNDRMLICTDVMNEILSWRCKYADCSCIIGGDFNVNLDVNGTLSSYLNKLLCDNEFYRSDVLSGCAPKFTYDNKNLQHFSTTDYLLCNNVKVTLFDLIDPAINYSDHLPLWLTCTVKSNEVDSSSSMNQTQMNTEHNVTQLRWDRADTVSYFYGTQTYLQPILPQLIAAEQDPNFDTTDDYIDNMYSNIPNSCSLLCSQSL